VFGAIRTRTGQWIKADIAARSHGPFRCGCCGAPVSLRSGDLRAPHFAHAQHRAKKDCEEYHPSNYVPLIDTIHAPANQNKRHTPDDLVWVGFAGDTPRTFAIVLRLPSAAGYPAWQGHIVAPTVRGELVLSCDQLRQGCSVELPPAVKAQLHRQPDCSVNNDYWTLIREAVPLLSEHSWTFFNDSPGVGARLADAAPLHCGDQYWGLLRRSAASDISGLDLVQLESTQQWEQGWWVHRFHLREDGSEVTSARAVAERVLGRTILPARPRIMLIDPPPHHLTPDGRTFVAAPCRRLLFRRSTALPVHATGPDDKIWPVDDIDDHAVAIPQPELGQWTLRIENVVFRLVIGEAKFFRPPGIRVEIADRAIDLVSLADVLARGEPIATTTQFLLTLPHAALEAAIRIDEEPWPHGQAALEIALLEGAGHRVDAAAFGVIDTRLLFAAPGQKSAATASMERLRPLVSWLVSVASSDGEIGLSSRALELDWEHAPDWLRRLRGLRWSSTFAPQLRNLLANLRRESTL